MDAKVVVVLALVLTALCLSDGEYARRRRLSRLWAPGSGLRAPCAASAPVPAPSLP